MMKHNSARKNSWNEEIVKYGVKQVYGSGDETRAEVYGIVRN
jgi:hypothetical protein